MLTPLGDKAIVDGRRVSLGERVSGYRVEAISAKGVTLARDGRRLELKLMPLTVKRPPESRANNRP